MNYAIWLDGVILKIDLTDVLYRRYKGEQIEKLEVTEEVFQDWQTFFDKLTKSVSDGNIVFLSPYDEDITRKIMKNIGLSSFSYISSKITKPSKVPYQILYEKTKWEPLETITIGSSALDLLSARFYDSRIKVVCINRFQDCSRYSPYLITDNLEKLYEMLKRLRKL
ncbi:HAD family hydrolase [Acidianus sp. HS-5]|uniref:HAD family hydrolase n=1 Tax=Acidianus sp. HS-5 TaxID=2886040 RepID=UPI001F3AEA80|nr:HAD family hydrolase [Acidianus sp. HS-5]BDC19120.1 hypothetical protein HS5_20100 [Acidianus sp. HS-5]